MRFGYGGISANLRGRGVGGGDSYCAMNALKFSTSESNSLSPVSRWILRNWVREMCWTYARISSLSGKSHQSGPSSPKSKKTCARLPAQSRNSALSAEETLRLDQPGG